MMILVDLRMQQFYLFHLLCPIFYLFHTPHISFIFLKNNYQCIKLYHKLGGFSIDVGVKERSEAKLKQRKRHLTLVTLTMHQSIIIHPRKQAKYPYNQGF